MNMTGRVLLALFTVLLTQNYVRPDDLILYTRYVELFERYRTASGTMRQTAFEAMIRHVCNDGMDMTEVTWPDDQPMTWKLSLDDHLRTFSGRWNLWFYVPEGATKIGLYVDTTAGQVIDSAGHAAMNLEDLNGQYVSIDVEPETAGCLWRLNQVAGKVCLMNVPPYAARTAEQLLLPTDGR
ncbi:MAG: hypothetical protein RIK87_23800 [Fuerstiella sp.]